MVFAQSLEHHELISQKIIDVLVACAEINAQDTVLEIGPGNGRITQALCKIAQSVIAVEKDSSCINKLNSLRAKFNTLELIQGNILDVTIPPWNKLVANPPFNILEPLLYWLSTKRFDCAALVVGEIFAEELLNEQYTRIFLFSQCYFNVLKEADISFDDFVPMPRNNPVIVKLTLKDKKELPKELIFLREFFGQQDKKIKNAFIEACTRILGLTQKQAKEKLGAIEIDVNELEKNVLLISNKSLTKIFRSAVPS